MIDSLRDKGSGYLAGNTAPKAKDPRRSGGPPR